MLKKKLSKSSDDNESSSNGAPLSSSSKKSRLSDENKPTVSEYFAQDLNVEDHFIDIQLRLNLRLKNLQFRPPVAYVYNPVEYAFKPNESYVRKYCTSPKKIIFVGMNPGPFGMCQTGVPFGEIKCVRDWLKIEEVVGKPFRECPKRPILGFDCTRSEVSGDRFWNLLKKVCKTPEIFFKNGFVYNYCPLALMKDDGCNLTPRDIKDHQELEKICDEFFYEVIQLLRPEIVVGIGEYAEKRTLAVLKQNSNVEVKVLRIPHPSPRAVNNQNWPEKAQKFLEDNNLISLITE